MKISYPLILVIMLSCYALFSAEHDGPDYEFTKDENCYIFKGSFRVKGEADSLLLQVFEPAKIIEYSINVSSIEILQQADCWYDVEFLYEDFWVYKNFSTWRRTYNKAENTIYFYLLASEGNMSFIPEIDASEGYYRITPENDECCVEVFVNCCLKAGILKDIYYKKAEEDAVEFLKIFQKFLSAH